MKKWVKLFIGICFVTIIIFLSRKYELDQVLINVRQMMANIGWYAPAVFILIYIIATILILPGSILTIMAGALFGSVIGVLTVIIGATIGASCCFLFSRYFARDFVASLLRKNQNFQNLDELTKKNGAIIVAITRLIPLFPFNLLNFGFGLTNVPFKIYVLWSALCMLPGTILYVVGSDAITTAINQGKVPWVLVIVLIIIIGILAILVKQAKKKLKE